MAIDPAISLAYKPPNYDPLQAASQQLGIQNLVAQQRLIPGQQQIQQQTIQANQLAIQQQQRDLNDQQMMTKALIQSKPGDLDDIAKNALQLGVSPKGLLAFQTQFSELARNRAMLSDEELKSQGAREQALTETAGSLLELPDVAARQAQWPNARANLILNWQMKPEQIPEQYPGDEWLNANYKVTAMGAAATMRALAMQQLASARSTALGNVKLGPGQVLVRPDASAAAPGPPLGQAPTPPQASMIGQGAVVPPQGGAIAPPTNFTPIQQTAPTSQAPGAPATGMVPPAPATGATVTPGYHVVASNPAPVHTPVPRAPTPTALAVTVNDPNATPEARQQAKAALLTLMQQHPVNPMNATPLTPEGLDLVAEQFYRTGQMTALGMGAAGMRAQIINRAGQLHPGADLSSNATAFAANKASLVGLQKNRDAVVAFENTANKNLDLFLSQAGKIVDSGSPWINSPLRTVDQKLLGNDELPAYNAARQVAINEIAKVTSNPGLTGQLSDAGRKEVADFNPQNATLQQTYNVAKILRQDMANRHQAYDDTIAAIKQRIGQGPSTPNTPPPQPNPTPNQQGGAPLPQGGGKAADAGIIKQFLNANGGDKDKTRQALIRSGWTIPPAQ